MPSLKHLPATATRDDVLNVLAEDAAVIIDGLMMPDHLNRVRTEIMPFVEATPPGRDDFTGRLTTRTGALVARSRACRDLVSDPLINAATEAFLAPFCDRYQLHLTQVIRIKPGQGAQVLHRDRLAWGGYLQRSIEPQLNMIWAVTDFTKENGATRVVPGSHLWEDGRGAHEEEITYAEMKAGSVIIYTGSVIHSGGANVSAADRVGINITYSLGWLRQEENQYLSCPPEIAAMLTPDLQRLIGYSMGSYALGYFSPPLPPGMGPEIVPPETLFSGEVKGWGDDLYAKVSRRVSTAS
ncbi:MAG: phytanoyl-CoA dioxygenase [Hyphomonas sp.]|uniref:phytanoyl-CoA dioxygenase family protein n=1 Tax=Hyphomonas sp. TaxID=87 RepID=UPI0025C1F46E|nr:phytanoyl-CoA dioxygenase family protein [Hyphomonas sp.]MBA4338384.1 phytanoyl-CoA dioxygenase [Hyphomonas sp.]